MKHSEVNAISRTIKSTNHPAEKVQNADGIGFLFALKLLPHWFISFIARLQDLE